MKVQIQAKVRAQAATPAVPAKPDGKGGTIAAVAAQPAKPEVNTTANFDMPADLASMSKAYGDTVVYAAAKGAIVISVQALMRRMLDAGKSTADIQAAVTAFKPDVKNVVKQTAFEKASNAITSLSADERKALLAKLTTMK